MIDLRITRPVPHPMYPTKSSQSPEVGPRPPSPSYPKRLFHNLGSKMSQHTLHVWALSFLLIMSAPFFRQHAPAAVEATVEATVQAVMEPIAEDTTSIYDAPNSIANEYPNSATGVLNGTLAIIPVELDRIKAIIPSGIDVLEDMYRSMLPGFPEGMYPVFMQAVHDHDIQFAAYGASIPDFSRMGLEFPFLDLRGEGTPFKWAPMQFISKHNELAIQGSRDYGTTVFESLFSPRYESYAHGPSNDFTMDAAADVNGTGYAMTTSFGREGQEIPYGLDFFKAVGDQITFAAAGGSCDRFTKIWDAEVDSTPTAVRGSVVLDGGVSPLSGAGGRQVFDGVWGIQVATAFKEDNYLDCTTV